MNYTKSDKLIAWLTLFSGLTVSAVAIFYSVAGLVAIFAAAAVPIIIMGVALEVSKLVATVWLKWNWKRAPFAIKSYLIAAISILMIITSMGIFGYLSKAHLDQAVPTGDVASKVELLDEKIKTQRDNIATARAALQQMDNQVNERLSRSTDDKGAERAVQIRRQQQTERNKLQQDIAKAQAEIAKLNEERSPIAAELRKVEAEVGPIKYIAALIYGDTADATLLEAAVRWVIIIIVIVFDPLAVILLLASQYSFQWFRQEKEETPQLELEEKKEEEPPLPEPEDTGYIPGPWPFPVREKEEPVVEEPVVEEPVVEETIEIVEEPVAEEEHHEEQILSSVTIKEKEAMQLWKQENPDGSLKIQRSLFKKGVIKELPWAKYMTNEDLSEVEEAKKWAEEHPETEEAKAAEAWAKEQESVSWMETDENGNQIKKIKDTYQQNAEQSERTIWQRIQDAKK